MSKLPDIGLKSALGEKKVRVAIEGGSAVWMSKSLVEDVRDFLTLCDRRVLRSTPKGN